MFLFFKRQEFCSKYFEHIKDCLQSYLSRYRLGGCYSGITSRPTLLPTPPTLTNIFP